MAEVLFDQNAWLNRIGYSGPLEPTLSTLNKLIFAHSHAIAYESLDIMLGRTPRLDLDSLQRKMISGGRGGYCLEQNMLFREALRSLGYIITSLQGRVVRGMPIDAPRPAIHMLLQVDLREGPYLADVGFGNLAPTSALLLKVGIEQDTPHEPMRFIDVGGELTLQSKLRDTWEHIYRVVPYPRYDDEYEITNWYTGTHPDAPYQSNIIAARPLPNRMRITMFNARLTVRHATGETERRILKDEVEFTSALHDEFGLNISDDEIRTCITIMERKGEKGPPHPFFA
jgi:N-hydroxyarylamine O-acetyltransferase